MFARLTLKLFFPPGDGRLGDLLDGSKRPNQTVHTLLLSPHLHGETLFDLQLGPHRSFRNLVHLCYSFLDPILREAHQIRRRRRLVNMSSLGVWHSNGCVHFGQHHWFLHTSITHPLCKILLFSESKTATNRSIVPKDMETSFGQKAENCCASRFHSRRIVSYLHLSWQKFYLF